MAMVAAAGAREGAEESRVGVDWSACGIGVSGRSVGPVRVGAAGTAALATGG